MLWTWNSEHSLVVHTCKNDKTIWFTELDALAYGFPLSTAIATLQLQTPKWVQNPSEIRSCNIGMAVGQGNGPKCENIILCYVPYMLITRIQLLTMSGISSFVASTYSSILPPNNLASGALFPWPSLRFFGFGGSEGGLQTLHLILFVHIHYSFLVTKIFITSTIVMLRFLCIWWYYLLIQLNTLKVQSILCKII